MGLVKIHHRNHPGLLLAALGPLFLVGCGNVLVRYETFLGKPLSADAQPAARAIAVSIDGAGNEGMRFMFEDNVVRFRLPLLERDPLAGGPAVPFIPTPGGGFEYADTVFFIELQIFPERGGFLILEPDRYLIRFNDSAEAAAPTSWAPRPTGGCNAIDRLPEVSAYGEPCWIRLVYEPHTIHTVERLTLVPPEIRSESAVYSFPEISYERGHFITYESIF